MTSAFRNNCRKIICIGRNYAYVSSYLTRPTWINTTRTILLPSRSSHLGSPTLKEGHLDFCITYMTNLKGELSRDHIAELNSAKPKQPFFFLKPTSSLLLPGQGPVLLPKGVKVHYEVELGLVIGQRLTDLDPEDHETALNSITSP